VTTDPAALPGLVQALAQADTLGRALLALLLAMSAASWVVLLHKAAGAWTARRRSAAFLAAMGDTGDADRLAAQLQAQGVREPLGHLAAQALRARRQAPAGEAAEGFVAHALRHAVDLQALRLESGLTLLATIGATAPFVGLLGTVWGVHHALVAVGADAAGSFDRIAGPVGEALVMTGLGLAVALPAVVGYNVVVRANRVALAKLDAFAHEVHARVMRGAAA
jgi:biopolymer transport protein ExbB